MTPPVSRDRPGTRVRTGPAGRARRTRAAALLGLAGALALAGCGIRPTQVPVEAGPAPSRVPCEVSADDMTPQSGRTGIPLRVYLVCATQLVPVERTAATPDDKAAASRLHAAQTLLDALQQDPSTAEHEAGLMTYLRGPLVLSGAREGDPEGTLRLSRPPEDLPAEGLAQLVCTLVETRSGRNGALLLGGPGDWAPRAYLCPPSVKERPEDVVPTRSPLPAPAPGAS
ncbi:hypothetical protein [Streptomyces sp. NPDC005805]|uniref:hypothetical protein n=1 Tax=Streptomyces sp. NPDC005805 TaxID=3157068 RepID=UPI0033CC83D7